ncbi:hypothetical protein JD844_017502 [Phrynosoma platyrhinos]|uniref:diphthine methyl ester synthase n=1 Tax=Phrynosoma platyrhinos TaxID=52577 RepID=A0ABQ7SM67_PHRPL|nr:hypothetical protein JD844_017502 [Phrynosoma platyrhinos]
MLYLIGLGLGDAKDITVKGLEVVKQCSRVYLEAYTSILTVGKEALEEFYGKELILADREIVEQEADTILKDAHQCDVAFLVVGDPFGATTHSDLVLRAVKLGIPYRVIHNASILNAVGCCGLQVHIKVKEQSMENLIRQLQGEQPEVTENTVCVGLARVGGADQKIASGTLQQMTTVVLGDPLHSLIITGTLHPLEVDMLKLFAVDKSIFEQC